MWHKERFRVGSDLVDDSVILAQDKGQLIIVHLELLFLEEDDFSALRNLNTDAREALRFTDKGHDL